MSDASRSALRGHLRTVKRVLIFYVAIGIPMAVWGFVVEPDLLFTREIAHDSAKWPASHAPLRIGFVADLHVGAPHAGLDKLAEVVDALNAGGPDIVLLGGDYLADVLGGEDVPPAKIARELGRLEAPLGAYAVLGNHDWWNDGGGMWTALEAEGVEVLENEAIRLERGGDAFWLVGIGDDMTNHDRAAEAMALATDDAPVLALMHDPSVWPEVGTRPVLTLAGHTHAGQVYLPIYGPLGGLPGRVPRRWTYGLIQEDGRDLFVTSGVGTSDLPVRFNAPPEIVFLTVANPQAAAMLASDR